MAQPTESGSSLTVLGGPLDGASFPLDLRFGALLIGSSSDSGLRLHLPGIAPVHARLSPSPNGPVVEDVGSPSGVFVNDDRLVGPTVLHDGDVLWLGVPGEPESVMLRARIDASALMAETVEDPFFIGEPEPVAPPPAGGDVDAFFIGDPPPVLATPATPQHAPDEFFISEPPAPPTSHPTAPAPPARPAAAPIEAFSLDEPARPPAAPKAAAPQPKPAPQVPVPPVAVPPVAPVAPAVAPKPVAPAPRVATTSPPVPPRPGAAPAPSRPARPAGSSRPSRPASARRPASSRARSASKLPLILGVLGLLAVAGAGTMFTWRRASAPALDKLEPTRTGVGQVVKLTGKNFGVRIEDVTVKFGDLPGKLEKLTPQTIEVAVPELPLVAGAETKVSVVVTVGTRATDSRELTVYQGPRLHGLSPDVAMPGDIIELVGAGWASGAEVHFGTLPASVVGTRADRIRVQVPEIAGPPGTTTPVTVTMAGAISNPGPFFIGRLPLLMGVEPGAAAPGETVTVRGRGFRPEPLAMGAAVGERRAVLADVAETEARIVVPWHPAGPTMLRLALNASKQVGEIGFVVKAPSDPLEFRFVAEVLDEDPSGEHVVIATGLGPAFLLSSSGGRSATARALEAVERLNASAAALKASADADFELRGLASGKPALGLKGQPEVLLTVTLEDAAGYNKDWIRQGQRTRPVTPGRLATWWAAVARDLLLMLVRNERPVHAAALGVEGKVLQDTFQAARKLAPFGVPLTVAAEPRPGWRVLALRVPAGVAEPSESPATPVAGPSAGAAAAAARAFKAEGEWRGQETVPEGQRFIGVVFKASTGTLTYESGFSVSFPLVSLQATRTSVRFSVAVRGGMRYYEGRFDGQRLTGTVAAEERGASIGSFELKPR